MSVAGRGIRNAFRNRTRAISIVLILGLAIGLALVMLIAHRAVGQKASTALSSIGNAVTIGPPGYGGGMQLGTRLTRAQLAPIAHLPGVTGIDVSLNGAATASNPVPRSAQPPANEKFKRVGGPTAKKTASVALQTG
ncbi:MAG TPA: hypothetical protein VG365_12095, partial [Solirubrobacteraceae bacterium]|nr:hypothetical protein [Solirubrobacteraceae bacterium]